MQSRQIVVISGLLALTSFYLAL